MDFFLQENVILAIFYFPFSEGKYISTNHWMHSEFWQHWCSWSCCSLPQSCTNHHLIIFHSPAQRLISWMSVALSCNYKHRGPLKFISYASSIFITQKLKTSMSPANEMWAKETLQPLNKMTQSAPGSVWGIISMKGCCYLIIRLEIFRKDYQMLSEC